ncbi:hypothetical protein HY486_02170 [Candidatus Woesearchaeota archaeon]|nr:hypothetical protein [Candidatus Woesearchaeota archaeon]
MKHPLLPTFLVLLLFTTTQIVGLLITRAYLAEEDGVIKVKGLPDIAGVRIERPELNPVQGAVMITLAVFLGTLLVLFLIWLKAIFLWKLWYFVAVTLLLHVALASMLSSGASLVIAVFLGLVKTFKPSTLLHNVTEILIYGGLSAIFVPIVKQPVVVLALLIVISLYDAIAVWKTKHMITLAKFQMEQKTFGGLMIPYKKSARVSHRRKYGGMAILGGGDMAFPLLFLGTLLLRDGFAASMIVLPFIVLLLALVLWKGQKGRFYPAMPFLTIGCVLGYALLLLV